MSLNGLDLAQDLGYVSLKLGERLLRLGFGVIVYGIAGLGWK